MSDVKATLNIEIYVTCPFCEAAIDMMAPSDTNGCDHNDDNYLLDQACPTNGTNWIDAHRDFECEAVTCSECEHEFDVKGLEW